MRWLPIRDYEDLYEIAENGRVRRASDSARAPTGFEQQQALNKKGYPTVGLSRDGFCRSFTTHRLVAMMFIGPKPKGTQVNHIDGVKTNNHWRNLEYVTCKQNIRHAVDNGLRGNFKGTANGCTKITEEDIPVIRAACASGESQSSVGRRYGLTQANVSMIVLRRTWSHVL
jgi:hypothetical protein